MKKIIDIVVQLIIMIMLIMTIFLPKKTFSENENRYLQKFPNLTIENVLDGKFMTMMTNYISDHFPLREELLNFKTNVFKLVGVKRQNNIYYAKDNYLIEEYEKPINNERIVRVVNRFIDHNKDVNYQFMLVPTSSSILSNKLSNYNLNYNQKDTLDYFKNNIHANYLDVYDILLNNNDKDIYYKTDHHWTTRGANYAYLSYCKDNNIVPNNYTFEIVSNNFYGTLYSKVIDNSLPHDIIEKIYDTNKYTMYYQDKVSSSIYNEDYLREKDKYSYFLNGNQPLIKIVNDDVNDKKILIIKDSYANSFIPLILPHYSEVHVIDPRYYKNKISDYIKDNNLTNILFLYNVGTIDDDLGILSIN